MEPTHRTVWRDGEQKDVPLTEQEKVEVRAEWAANKAKKEAFNLAEADKKARKDAAFDKLCKAAGLSAEEKSSLCGTLI